MGRVLVMGLVAFLKGLQQKKYKVKGQILRPWIHNFADYIGVTGH
jgi:hypothetical protein